ncbi:MAG: hypothetical protein MJ231_02660, partial [bacterium]|nr:hypothetical protein [bacterium]
MGNEEYSIQFHNGKKLDLNNLKSGLNKKDINEKFHSLFDVLDFDQNEVLTADELLLLYNLTSLKAGADGKLSENEEKSLFEFLGINLQNKTNLSEFIQNLDKIKDSKEGYCQDGTRIVQTTYENGNIETLLFYPDGGLKVREMRILVQQQEAPEFITPASKYQITKTYSERAKKDLQEQSMDWVLEHVNENLNIINDFQQGKGFLEKSAEAIMDVFGKSLSDIQKDLVDQKYFARLTDLTRYNEELGGSFDPAKYEKFIETDSKYMNVRFWKSQTDELQKGIQELKKSVQKDKLRKQGINVPVTEGEKSTEELFADVFNKYCANNTQFAQQLMKDIAGDVKNPKDLTSDKMLEIIDKFDKISKKLLNEALNGETYEQLEKRFHSEYKSLYGKDDYTDYIQKRIGSIEGVAGLEKIAIITITQIILGIVTGGGSAAAEGVAGAAMTAGGKAAGKSLVAKVMASQSVKELVAKYGEAKVLKWVQQSGKLLMLTGTVAEDIGIGFINAATSENGITWEKSQELLKQGISSAKYIYFGGYISGPIATFVGRNIKTSTAVAAAFKNGTKVTKGAIQTTTISADKFLSSMQSKAVKYLAGTASLTTEIGAFALLDLATEDVSIKDALSGSADMQIKLKIMNRLLETLLGGLVHKISTGNATAMPKLDAEIKKAINDKALKNMNVVERKTPTGTLYSIEADGKILCSAKDPNMLVISLTQYLASTMDMAAIVQEMEESEAKTEAKINIPKGKFEAPNTKFAETPEAFASIIKNRATDIKILMEIKDDKMFYSELLKLFSKEMGLGNITPEIIFEPYHANARCAYYQHDHKIRIYENNFPKDRAFGTALLAHELKHMLQFKEMLKTPEIGLNGIIEAQTKNLMSENPKLTKDQAIEIVTSWYCENGDFKPHIYDILLEEGYPENKIKDMYGQIAMKLLDNEKHYIDKTESVKIDGTLRAYEEQISEAQAYEVSDVVGTEFNRSILDKNEPINTRESVSQANITPKTEVKSEEKTEVKTNVISENNNSEITTGDGIHYATQITDPTSVDALILLGALHGESEIMTPEIAKSRGYKILESSAGKADRGLRYAIYEGNGKIFIVADGYNTAEGKAATLKDSQKGAHDVTNAYPVLKGTGMQLYTSEEQIIELEKIYKTYFKQAKNEGKQLVVAGYSIGGASVKEIASKYTDDTETNFITFNAHNNNKAPINVKSYVIDGDKKSNGNNSSSQSTKFSTSDQNKHSLDAFWENIEPKSAEDMLAERVANAKKDDVIDLTDFEQKEDICANTSKDNNSRNVELQTKSTLNQKIKNYIKTKQFQMYLYKKHSNRKAVKLTDNQKILINKILEKNPDIDLRNAEELISTWDLNDKNLDFYASIIANYCSQNKNYNMALKSLCEDMYQNTETRERLFSAFSEAHLSQEQVGALLQFSGNWSNVRENYENWDKLIAIIPSLKNTDTKCLRSIADIINIMANDNKVEGTTNSIILLLEAVEKLPQEVKDAFIKNNMDINALEYKLRIGTKLKGHDILTDKKSQNNFYKDIISPNADETLKNVLTNLSETELSLKYTRNALINDLNNLLKQLPNEERQMILNQLNINLSGNDFDGIIKPDSINLDKFSSETKIIITKIKENIYRFIYENDIKVKDSDTEAFLNELIKG